jgi:D-ribose pyranose/furanose isomerase RbsD
VTVIVATTGALVALVAVNDAMFPAPEAARPIDGALFVQLNTVPGTLPLKLTAVVAVLLHKT